MVARGWGGLPWQWQRGPSYAQSLCSLAPLSGDVGGLTAHPPLCGWSRNGSVGGAGTQRWGKSRQQAVCYGGWGGGLEGGILHSSCSLYKWGEKAHSDASKVGLTGKVQGREAGFREGEPNTPTLLSAPRDPMAEQQEPLANPSVPQFPLLQHSGAAWTPNTPQTQQGPCPHCHPHTRQSSRGCTAPKCTHMVPDGWEGPSPMGSSEPVSLPASGAAQESIQPPHP